MQISLLAFLERYRSLRQETNSRLTIDWN